jgi:hypothetical protein
MRRDRPREAETPHSPSPAPVEVIYGGMLCAVRFWTEAEWAALPERHRPSGAAHKPGVGWVGPVPVTGLN